MGDGFIEKEKFYETIDNKLKAYGITKNDYPLKSIELAEALEEYLFIETIEFPSARIGGMLCKGEVYSKMALNSLRSDKGRNFDCMHELIHLWFHPPLDEPCIIDGNILSQKKGYEWQANEGAAHALMPRDLFIEKYLEFHGNNASLSDYFFVSETSIKYRIMNLNLPRIVKIRNNIVFPSMFKNRRMRHCPFCNNAELTYYDNYCKICGNDTLCSVSDNEWTTYQGLPGNYNRCTDKSCGKELESNARYCTSCGQQSTLYKNGRLKDWSDIEYMLFKRMQYLESKYI